MEPEIIPAIMPESYEEIESSVRLVRHSVHTVQLDLMDGVFVPEETWPFLSGSNDLPLFQKGDLGFPLWNDMNYELDLMVARPEERLEDWLGMGASRIVFHYASVHDWNKIHQIDHIARNFIEIGVAITIHDTLEDIYPLIDEKVVDYVQCMGINEIGYQGEPFEPKILDVIKTLRKKYPELPLSIDGGVSTETIESLYQAGITRFVSGSSVYGSGMPSENIDDLYQKLEY